MFANNIPTRPKPPLIAPPRKPPPLCMSPEMADITACPFLLPLSGVQQTSRIYEMGAQSGATLTDRHFRRADGAPPPNPPSRIVTSAAHEANPGYLHRRA
jgi:hypothetical protein